MKRERESRRGNEHRVRRRFCFCFRRSTPTASFSLSHVSSSSALPVLTLFPPLSHPPRSHALAPRALRCNQFKKTKQASFWTVRRKEKTKEKKNKGKKIESLFLVFFKKKKALERLFSSSLSLSLCSPTSTGRECSEPNGLPACFLGVLFTTTTFFSKR